ncbi:MAG: aldo/keto reductase [Mariniphaga sp.]|nr:aldo/keto reductase [Mariniphaga sp.]
MRYRRLGKTGFNVSEISLGTWQVGGKWGEPFSNANADETINTAIDSGINFIDTADVYNDGLSEKAIGRVLRTRSERVYVATKCGRQLNPHVNEGYQPAVLRKFVEASLKNMNLDCLDLIQLHCPPTQVYYRPEIFELFDTLKQEGKILNLGVSVEKPEEALKALEYSNVCTAQIIFNMFRPRPSELFFKEAKRKDIGIIARVPLASGMLTGKFSTGSKFSKDDHRNFNIDGAAFDKGETFSGIDYTKGLEAVEKLKTIFPDQDLAAIALKWILMFDEISCVIPGASTSQQSLSNLKALDLSNLSNDETEAVKAVYEKYIKYPVHFQW